MATQSVQDIDSFIRLQKEKLSRDKFSDSRGGYQVSVRMLIIRKISTKLCMIIKKNVGY
jgi:hypothetical protein